MSKVKFEYNLIKDAYNYARTILFFKSFRASKGLGLIPKEIQEEVKRLYKIYPVSHSELMDMHCHKIFKPIVIYLKNKFNRKRIEQHRRTLGLKWKNIEREYFKILSNILQKSIYPANYICYLTTLYSCPYCEKRNWFMVSVFSSLPNQAYVACHEFMHLQFIHWYKKYCLKKGLTDKEFWHIKEAITFLLNEPEFNDIIVFQDKGYAIHQKLRKRLKRLWRKNKNFKHFLDEVITYKQDYLGKTLSG